MRTTTQRASARRATALLGLLLLPGLLGACGAIGERAGTSSSAASTGTGPDPSESAPDPDATDDAGSGDDAPEGEAPADDRVLATATSTIENFGSSDIATADLRLDVLEVQRVDGDAVTVRFSMTSLATDGDFRFYDQFAEEVNREDVSAVTLEHLAGDTRYLTLLDSEGGCLCTEVPATVLSPGQSVELSAQFAAPEGSDVPVVLNVPGFPALDLVIP